MNFTKDVKNKKAAKSLKAGRDLSKIDKVPGEWKLSIEEFAFAGCHHNSGGTD